MEPKWLGWARRLQGLAQSGLAYSQNPFEIERFKAVREIAVEMMASQSETDFATVQNLFEQQFGYATPKIDARGVVFQNDKILLVRERSDGLWTLPGGFADVAESPSEAVVREVFEESGYQTRAIKLLALWDRTKQGHLPPRPFRMYKIVMLCELLGGQPVDNLETEGASFFAENEIPDLSLARVTPTQIKRIFEHLRHPEWPADFD